MAWETVAIVGGIALQLVTFGAAWVWAGLRSERARRKAATIMKDWERDHQCWHRRRRRRRG